MADEPQYTGVVLVLIPTADDPTVAASSEPAHLTTVWMGDIAEGVEEKIPAILAEAEAYAARLDGPVVVPVVERGTLGDEDADVVFLERTEALVALRDGLLEVSPTIREAFEAAEQFPEWTPHVTLGYPETPATGEYAGETVTFDRIGIWAGEEQHNFVMGGEMASKIEASAVAEAVGEVDDDEEMPLDELEDGEELITEIPVHGVATIEGRATGDGRGFRKGALSIGKLPQPLGYEFEHGHGSDNSRVAVVGRIDEFFRKEGEEYDEVRWRGVILTTKEYAAAAIDSIVDGSYTGVSVILDSVEVDVEEERARVRAMIEADEAGQSKGAEGPEPSEMSIDEIVDMMVGDGKQPVTWFTAGRVRRFDMVPTGAFQEGYIGLGHEFVDELEPEQIEAAALALADCGCSESADAILTSVLAAGGIESFAPGTKDGPGWITHPVPTARIRRYWTKGKGAAKIAWGSPGDFNRCRAQLAKYVQNPDWLAGMCANMHKEVLGIWPGEHHAAKYESLVASGAAPAALFALTAAADPIDAKFFRLPEDLEDHGIGVVIDGDWIYGYIAHWNVCHLADPEGPGRCTMAPESRSNYAHFRTGTVQTTEGPMAVGSITMGTGHAGGDIRAASAVAHYDNTGTVVADVACGENSVGIWYAGRVRPTATEEQRYQLAASGRLSGDWRNIGGDYELVAALAVNVPGFPIPRASLAASAYGGMSLVAAGMVDPDLEVVEAPRAEALTADDISAIAIAAVESFIAKNARTERLAPARVEARARLLAHARRRFATITED